MNTQELEAILEGGTETQKIEFKGACDWNVRSLAKDILALSNVQEGVIAPFPPSYAANGWC